MNKIFEKLLEQFKRSNEVAKEKMATRFGFKTPQELEAYLKQSSFEPAVVKVGKKKKEKVTLERVIVHNVHILDASGSMAGDKINVAIKGINQEIEDMKKDDSTEVTQTIIHFSYPDDIITHCWKTPLSSAYKFHTTARGSTALLQTIGETLTKLLSEANDKDKYLVKIFTDGEENASVGEWKNPKRVANLIKEAENKGFTVTFVGTEKDIAYVVRLLSIDESNTLSHKNTIDSIGATYMMSSNATAKYRVAAAKGLDVKHEFFRKKTGTL